ncbi:MAG: DoxX family membrane protein [Bacteroidota bacterium]
MKYNNAQISWLVILRLAIGWHFLYEGLVKLMNPNWSSVGFLLDSGGFMQGFFHGLASNPATVNMIDILNIWGLILIGLSLILGFLARPACIFGILLLLLYYLSHPPFVGIRYAVPAEGSYLIINKNLIEVFALAVLFVFPSSRKIGIDRFIFKKR